MKKLLFMEAVSKNLFTPHGGRREVWDKHACIVKLQTLIGLKHDKYPFVELQYITATAI